MYISKRFLDVGGSWCMNVKYERVWGNIRDFVALFIHHTPIELNDYHKCLIGGSTCRHVSAKEYTGKWLEELHDVEIIVEMTNPLKTTLDKLRDDGTIQSLDNTWGAKHRIITFRGMKFDMFHADPKSNWGVICFYRIGSADYNKVMVTKIKADAPFGLHEGHAWVKETMVKKYDSKGNWWYEANKYSQRLLIPTERNWFELCGLPYIEPHMRTERTLGMYFALPHQWGDVTKFYDVAPPLPPQPAPETKTLF